MPRLPKPSPAAPTTRPPPEARAKKLGRKRDESLDGQIIDSALTILGEVGFDRMTMDMVATRAGAGKATVYRRWASKVDLVKDALIWMSHQSVELEHVPDTGRLRDDLLGVMKPHSIEHGERKLRVLARLGSFFTEHPQAAEETLSEIFDSWTVVNRRLMERAQARGELPSGANLDLACEVIAAVVSYRSQVKRQSFSRQDYTLLLDTVILPALMQR